MTHAIVDNEHRFEIPIMIDAIRRDRQESLEWIDDRLDEQGKRPEIDGPVEVEIRAEYPPPKSLSKKKMAAMQAGETVYRPVHPACDQLAHLLLEVRFPHSVAQGCRLTVEKIYAEKARVIITIRSLK